MTDGEKSPHRKVAVIFNKRGYSGTENNTDECRSQNQHDRRMEI
jgi:hypothetical protein